MNENPKAARKTTATNKRLCGGRITYVHANFAPCPTLRRFMGSVTRKRVSCRPFTVTAGKTLPAGSSALRKTSQSLDVVGNIAARQTKQCAENRKQIRQSKDKTPEKH